MCGVLRCLAAALLPLTALHAERGAGELRLKVRDPAGNGIPATAEVRGDSTKTAQSVDLPADGLFSFKNLPFGFYKLRVSNPGFAPYSSLVEIRSEAPKTLEVTLGIQPIATTLDVTQAQTLVDPSRVGSANYIGSDDVRDREIGLAGRSLLNLVAQQPGWTFEANGILHPRESEYETQVVVNGFPYTENRSPAFAPSMEADDVQSIKAYTSGIPAEFGRKMGGVIEIDTERNTSPGFHGLAVAQGGSFGTAGGFLSAQYVTGKTTGTVTAEGFLTGRFLDPTVIANYTNHASSSSFTGTVEHDFSDSDRLRVSATHRETKFEVPDELIQYAAGQRQDRGSAESEGQVFYQHVFSPQLVGAVRGMFRDVSADLLSNPLTVPISADQDRGYRESYLNGSLSGHWGRHEWKAGTEATFASIREKFDYSIAAYQIAGVPIFDPSTPSAFHFNGTHSDREQSAYLQDLIRLGNFTVSAGLRFDHYSLLVDQTAFSPRLGLSYFAKPLGLVLHASYDRTFGTPPFENILVSASMQARALNPGAVYLPLQPSRGNYYEAGLTQRIFARMRLDVNFFRRDIRNDLDDDLLENTGVSFPIAFHSAEIRGVEVKLETPQWGPFTGFLSYSNSIGVAQLPIAGGLFLEDGSAALLNANDRFPITQDQRNTARAKVRYQVRPRVWTAFTGTYNSGLPVDNIGASQTSAFLISQYGQAVVNSVNFDRGRVHPYFSVDASVGVDLWKKEKRSVSVQADVLNLTDRLNVINFAGLLSGTAIAPPRSFGFRLRTGF